MTKTQIVLSGVVAVLVGSVFFWKYYDPSATVDSGLPSRSEPEVKAEEAPSLWGVGEVSERYSARVDRVDVVFEQKDFVQYRLQTNGLVRTGALNTERGFKEDVDATVYVLNWQKPEGEQIRYVRLTAEPTHLYYIDSEGEIILGSKLTLDPT